MRMLATSTVGRARRSDARKHTSFTGCGAASASIQSVMSTGLSPGVGQEAHQVSDWRKIVLGAIVGTGYSVKEEIPFSFEIPFFFMVFLIPTTIALLVWWRYSRA